MMLCSENAINLKWVNIESVDSKKASYKNVETSILGAFSKGFSFFNCKCLLRGEEAFKHNL